MAKASDNTFPKVIISEGTAPSSPSAGSQKLFIDSADNKLKRKNSAGTVTTIEGGSVASDTIFDAKGDLAVGTAADTAARLAVGTNGQVLTADSAEATGLKWATAAGGGFTPKVKFVRYSTNNLEFTSTTYVAFSGPSGASIGTALDLTIPSGSVSVGDTIEVGGDLFWDAQGVDGNISFGSLVSSAIVNTFPGNKGIPGLVGPASQYRNASGSAFYVVQSGDLSSGALTVRPLAKGSAASVKRLISNSPDSCHFWVKNWGPQ